MLSRDTRWKAGLRPADIRIICAPGSSGGGAMTCPTCRQVFEQELD
eukprot:gene9349-biopygen10722